MLATLAAIEALDPARSVSRYLGEWVRNIANAEIIRDWALPAWLVLGGGVLGAGLVLGTIAWFLMQQVAGSFWFGFSIGASSPLAVVPSDLDR